MTYISKITSSNLTYVFLKYFQNHVVIFAIKTLMPDFWIQTFSLGPRYFNTYRYRVGGKFLGHHAGSTMEGFWNFGTQLRTFWLARRVVNQQKIGFYDCLRSESAIECSLQTKLKFYRPLSTNFRSNRLFEIVLWNLNVQFDF